MLRWLTFCMWVQTKLSKTKKLHSLFKKKTKKHLEEVEVEGRGQAHWLELQDLHRRAIFRKTSAPEQTLPQGSELLRRSADQNAEVYGNHHFFHPREVHYFYEPVCKTFQIWEWHLVEGGQLYGTQGRWPRPSGLISKVQNRTFLLMVFVCLFVFNWAFTAGRRIKKRCQCAAMVAICKTWTLKVLRRNKASPSTPLFWDASLPVSLQALAIPTFNSIFCFPLAELKGSRSAQNRE